MTHSFEKNTVYTQSDDTGRTALARFKDPVLKLVELPGALCVVTEPDIRAVRATNLFAMDLLGRLLWSASPSFAASDKNVFVDARPIADAPDQLAAWDWDGNHYVFSVPTGEELSHPQPPGG
jgi:hypothetical protein